MAQPPHSPDPAAATSATPKGAVPSGTDTPDSTAARRKWMTASAPSVTAEADSWTCPVSRDCRRRRLSLVRIVSLAVMPVSSSVYPGDMGNGCTCHYIPIIGKSESKPGRRSGTGFVVEGGQELGEIGLVILGKIEYNISIYRD